MKRLSAHGIRTKLNLDDLSEEDRSTYRRWARAWCIFGSIFVAGLIMVGYSVREPNNRAAGQAQAIGPSAVVIPARQPHPGG